VNASRITDHCLNLTLLFALFVFLLCRLTSGAFTIDANFEKKIKGTLVIIKLKILEVKLVEPRV
jgi:hypothetical protein